MFIVTVEVLFSCKGTNYAAKREQASTDRQRDAKARQAKRAYNTAKKKHINKQDRTTKKRMKQQSKQQKKQYQKRKGGGKSSMNCPARKNAA